MIGVWNMDGLAWYTLAGAKPAQILLSKTVRINWGWPGCVNVEEGIGEEGWAALASVLQRHPGFKGVHVPRAYMLRAPRAALKIIWDAMGGLWFRSRWVVNTDDGYIGVVKDGVIGVTMAGEDELKWAKLTEILNMSESQFLADKNMFWGEFEDEDEESESESDEESEGVEEQVGGGLEEEEQEN